MTTYNTIQTTDYIGDSLPNINANYYNLELDSFNIKTSADNIWNPMAEYYLNFSKFLKDTTTICQQNSSLLLNVATIVENNSAGWIKPITIFYPSIFPKEYPLDSLVESVSSWVSSYFPVINPIFYTSDDNGNLVEILPTQTNYVEGQTAIIYTHTWEYGAGISENTLLTDYTICYTQDKSVCTTCIDRYSGYVHCSNGDFNCSGQSVNCSTCGTLHCYYQTPPYNTIIPPPTYRYETQINAALEDEIVYIPQKHGIFIRIIKKVVKKVVRWITTVKIPIISPTNQTAYGAIAANVEMSFQDRGESDIINGLIFKIKNCNWVFDSYLSRNNSIITPPISPKTSFILQETGTDYALQEDGSSKISI